MTMTIAQLYERSRDESLTLAERDLAQRQAEAAVHNECYHTGPGQMEKELREAQREVYCSPCGDLRERCGHPRSYRDDEPEWWRCQQHGGSSQTECDVTAEVTSAGVDATAAGAVILRRLVQVEERIAAHHPRAAKDGHLSALLQQIRDEAGPLTWLPEDS